MSRTFVETDESGVVHFIYYVRCDICHAEVLKEDLEQHTIDCKLASSAQVTPSRETTVWQLCRFCNTLKEKEKLLVHEKYCLKNPQRRVSHFTAARSAPPPDRGVVWSPRGQKRQASPPVGMVLCPHCASPLKPKKLKSHLQHRCPKRNLERANEPMDTEVQFKVQPGSVSQKKAAPPKSQPQFAVCPRCRQRVREDRLAAHMDTRCVNRSGTEPPVPDKIRRPETVEVVTKRPAKTKKRQSLMPNIIDGRSESNSPMVEAFRQAFDEAEDGSRLYAHRYTENGRFGSYPIHDDYSEESGPD